MSKEKFKEFARNNPSLADSVLNKSTSWQQLYEIYEIYGEDNSIWKKYIKKPNITENITDSATTIKGFINTLKNLDMESVQQGITNIEKTINLLQDIGITSNNKNNNIEPIYRRFQ